MSTVVDGPAIRELTVGIGFTEGPVWTSWGRIAVVSMSRGLVYEIDLADGEVTRTWETGGGPNGCAEGDDGTLWVAQNGAATMVSPSPRPVSAGLQNLVGDEVRDVLTEGCMAPNDLVLGPDGLWWFTDPTPLPGQDRGRVCTFDPASGEMRTQIEGIHFPNGLAFGLDPTELYVAASLSHDILRYRVTPDGVEDLGQWGVLPGSSPDGIAFDAQGRLFVAAFLHDSVAVFAPDGQLERTISTGACSRPTNLCFAGDDLRTLVVTAAKGGRLLVVDEEFDGRLPSPWVSRVG